MGAIDITPDIKPLPVPITLSAHGLDVATEFMEVPNDFPALKVSATVGSTTEEAVITFGADDAAVTPTVEVLQNALDDHRARLVNLAAFKESVKQLLPQVK
jgi:hypothetical protein